MRPIAVPLAALAVAAMIVAGAYFVTQGPSVNPGGTSTIDTTSLSTSSSSVTSAGASATGEANSTGSLQLQLKLSFYHGADAGVNGTTMVSMTVDEYNLRVSSSNISTASSWGVTGLSDGACGTFDLPYGVGIFQGYQTATNLTQGQQRPLQVFAPVPCPMMVRYVTGYLFQPSSDMALILPGTGNATQMLSTVNATGIYSPMMTSTASDGMGGATSTSLITPFPPGVYTAVAGDEWGALVVLHFTIDSSGMTTPIG
jgi:hypothetical protein